MDLAALVYRGEKATTAKAHLRTHLTLKRGIRQLAEIDDIKVRVLPDAIAIIEFHYCDEPYITIDPRLLLSALEVII